MHTIDIFKSIVCILKVDTLEGVPISVWKLVLVRAGLAPETLPDTYHDERHAAAIENLRLTDNTMRFLVPKPGFSRWRRDTILRLSLPFKFMRRYVNAGHMSNPFTYQNSPIISEDKQLMVPKNIPKEQQTVLKRYRLAPPAGSLAPVVILVDASNKQPVSLLDRLGRGFVVLYFCTDAEAGIALLDKVRADLPGIPTALYLVTPRPPANSATDSICVLLDEEGKGAAAYNAGTRTLYLVRPDRHIAARRFESDLSELPMLLRHAIGVGTP